MGLTSPYSRFVLQEMAILGKDFLHCTVSGRLRIVVNHVDRQSGKILHKLLSKICFNEQCNMIMDDACTRVIIQESHYQMTASWKYRYVLASYSDLLELILIHFALGCSYPDRDDELNAGDKSDQSERNTSIGS